MRATVLLALVLTACGGGSTGVYETDEDADAGVDAKPRGDGGDEDDAGDDPCDEDGDGFRSVQCGGPDCCDLDPRTFPGQPKWFDEPNACGSWDYNCDDVEELEFPNARDFGCVSWFDQKKRKVECGVTEKSGVPSCGEAIVTKIGVCADGPDCVPYGVEQQTQRCR